MEFKRMRSVSKHYFEVATNVSFVYFVYLYRDWVVFASFTQALIYAYIHVVVHPCTGLGPDVLVKLHSKRATKEYNVAMISRTLHEDKMTARSNPVVQSQASQVLKENRNRLFEPSPER